MTEIICAHGRDHGYSCCPEHGTHKMRMLGGHTRGCPDRDPTSDADLSRLLFEARELVSMFTDVVESQTGKTDHWGRRVTAELDRYRADRGWSPDGYGGET